MSKKATKKPFVISFLSQKGGVGKTTLACFFAWFLHEKKQSVVVADLDASQLSAVNWASRRAQGIENENEEINVLSGKTAKGLASSISSYEHNNFLLIDTPGKASAETLAIAKISHVMVIPINTSFMTLQPQVLLVQELQRKSEDLRAKAFLFILNNTNSKEAVGTYETKEYIASQLGMSKQNIVLETALQCRRGYEVASNYGRSLGETSHHSLNEIAIKLGEEFYTYITKLNK